MHRYVTKTSFRVSCSTWTEAKWASFTDLISPNNTLATPICKLTTNRAFYSTWYSCQSMFGIHSWLPYSLSIISYLHWVNRGTKCSAIFLLNMFQSWIVERFQSSAIVGQLNLVLQLCAVKPPLFSPVTRYCSVRCVIVARNLADKSGERKVGFGSIFEHNSTVST